MLRVARLFVIGRAEREVKQLAFRQGSSSVECRLEGRNRIVGGFASWSLSSPSDSSVTTGAFLGSIVPGGASMRFDGFIASQIFSGSSASPDMAEEISKATMPKLRKYKPDRARILRAGVDRSATVNGLSSRSHEERSAQLLNYCPASTTSASTFIFMQTACRAGFGGLHQRLPSSGSELVENNGQFQDSTALRRSNVGLERSFTLQIMELFVPATVQINSRGNATN